MGPVEALRQDARASLAWARAHPGPAALAALALAGAVADGTYRAAGLHTSDLVAGYLAPTRGILFEGKNAYVDYTLNAFTPFFYCVMALPALLPNGLASVLWSLLMLAQAGAGLALFARVLAREEPGAASGSAAWVGLLAAPLLFNNLALGQSNVFALFFVCLGLYLLAEGREGPAGLALAVAAAFKVTPALWLGYLALRGRWRALGGAALGLVLCLAVVPALVFGPTRAWADLGAWAGLVLLPFVSGQKVRSTNITWYHTNQSLEALLNRELTGYGRAEYGGPHPGALLSEDAVRLLALALKLALLGYLAWAIWRRRGAGRWASDTALLAMATWLLSPVAWVSHYISAALAYRVALGRPASRGPLALALLGSLLALTSSGVQSYSPLLLGHAWLLARLLRSAGPGQPG